MQAASSRCWRCSNAAHTCETCQRYRPSVALGLGSCADDPAGTPVPANASRTCWDGSPGPDAAAGPAGSPGLFAELGPPPTQASPQLLELAADQPAPVARPPLEEPGRAAWVERDEDRLVVAPAVEPGRRITSELQRRRERRLD